MFLFSRFLIALLLLSGTAVAGDHTINGLVKSNAAKDMNGVTVSLLRSSDSAWMQSQLTDNAGHFSFLHIANGTYLINVSSIGYAPLEQTLTLAGDTEVINITLTLNNKALKEITITAKRPFIETMNGGMVINVENAITSAGTDVLELLRKSPGIAITDNGTISMQGKQGVQVWIDNRPTYLSGEQLAQYLKSLPAEDVAKLELLTQPSARYDAEGSSGIIHIKTKKTKKEGLKGSVSATYAQSRYTEHNESLRLSYRKNKTGLFTNLSYRYDKTFTNQQLFRNFRNINSYNITGTWAQGMTITETAPIWRAELGGDYACSDNTSVGVTANYTYTQNPQQSLAKGRLYDAVTGITTENVSDNRTEALRKNGTATAYIKHAFSKKNEISFNLDYLQYNAASTQDAVNNNYSEAGQALPNSLILKGKLPSAIKVYSAKADHSLTTGKWKLEAGVKASYVKTDNEALYEVLQTNNWVYDSTRSNHFLYNENINACYINASKDIGFKWQLQAGLRAENTNADGLQTIHQQDFTRHYTSLFPTLYAGYSPDSNQKWELNYGRRINRPDYSSLNPFIQFLSQYNYLIGNPALLPEYSHNFELKHAYKNKLFTTLNYKHTNGIREHIIVQNDTTKVVYSQPKNFAKNDNISLSVIYSHQLYTWWQTTVMGYGFYTAYAGSLDNKPINLNSTGYGFNLNNQFSFTSKWAAECVLDYTGTSQEGLLRQAKPWFYSAVGISKKVMSDKGSVKLSMRDLFSLYEYDVNIRLNDLDTHASIRYNTSQYALTFTYNFGRNLDNIRKAESGIGDEAGRINMKG